MDHLFVTSLLIWLVWISTCPRFHSYMDHELPQSKPSKRNDPLHSQQFAVRCQLPQDYGQLVHILGEGTNECSHKTPQRHRYQIYDICCRRQREPFRLPSFWTNFHCNRNRAQNVSVLYKSDRAVITWFVHSVNTTSAGCVLENGRCMEIALVVATFVATVFELKK